ncbi:MAG: protein-L-isoaspartate(D-aspartate) O-methyltransferase [Alphaproteobacteria bacterium]|jgi:protein-L-isoaspartate(D-aspartate) O-methyltransferase
METSDYAALRRQMIETIAIHALHVGNAIGEQGLGTRVMEVMGRVARHEFVPAELRPHAYIDHPLPIGFGKTISQPFMVALMTDLLDVQASDSVLELGTGLGYQAAVLADLAEQVYTVEIIGELALAARSRLEDLGYANVEVRLGDGSKGWPEHAPFDKVIVTAAPELVPPSLITQLKPGGRMVVPAGLEDDQRLMLVEMDDAGNVKTREVLPVCFSPLVTIH